MVQIHCDEKIELIINDIEGIIDRDQEIDLEYFGKLFFQIARLTKIKLSDYERYFNYAFNTFNSETKRVEKEVKNDSKKV